MGLHALPQRCSTFLERWLVLQETGRSITCQFTCLQYSIRTIMSILRGWYLYLSLLLQYNVKVSICSVLLLRTLNACVLND